MSALRILALSYLASASVFVVAATLVTHPAMMRQAASVARLFRDRAPPDYVSPVVRLTMAPQADAPVPHHLVKPADARITDDRLTDPDFSASASVTILPDLSPEAAPVPAEPKMIRPPVAQMPQFDIARAEPAFKIPEPPPLSGSDSRGEPFQNLPPVAHNRAEAAALRLKSTLTPEMLQNFDLFLYVSKADHGPLAQRMVVFRKSRQGNLGLLYDWAASTGREQSEVSPRGKSTFTATPTGFYELDPERMYRRYHSYSWDQDMPHAMFFNWERQGLQTGLAIHSATGDDIARLGSRASAGCVHLSPENAATLYDLIRGDYRGDVPRFAYNYDTDTMSNRGDFMHRRDGSLKMKDGYRVLVEIEDVGGEKLIASL
jgi:hypothetical protein